MRALIGYSALVPHHSSPECVDYAVTPDDVERVGCGILSSQVLALSAGTVEGIFAGVMSIARAVGLLTAGEDLVAKMRSGIRPVTDAVRNKPTPTVVMLEWTDPIFSMGNWGPELVEAANGEVLLAEKGQFSRAISWNEVRDADPDFLIIAPCGYDMGRTMRELPLLEALPGWRQLKSVRAGGSHWLMAICTSIVLEPRLLRPWR